jgi:hypothetical protein
LTVTGGQGGTGGPGNNGGTGGSGGTGERPRLIANKFTAGNLFITQAEKGSFTQIPRVSKSPVIRSKMTIHVGVYVHSSDTN